MSNVSEYSTTAGSNNGSPPDGAPEGMAEAAVNNVIREIMAGLAKWFQDQRGGLASAGSSNAYTVTSNGSYAALTDIPVLTFRADRANTGAVTLNVDGLGAKSLYKGGSLQEFQSGELKVGQMITVVYNTTDDHFETVSNTTAVTVPKGHKHGLRMALDADTDHDITVNIGECADDGATDLLRVTTAFTKQLDAGWSVGDDAGGLDTGSVASNTDYHMFVIKRSDTGVVDALFSTSATNPTMPTNYDLKRRIGSFTTDDTANIIEFYQQGDYFYVKATSEITATNNLTGVLSEQLSDFKVPAGIRVRPFGQVKAEVSNGGDVTVNIGPPEGGGDDGFRIAILDAEMQESNILTAGCSFISPFYTNTSSQLYIAVINDDTTEVYDIDLFVKGWVDDYDRFM